MTKKELRDYYQWFQAAMPDRIAELATAVSRSPGYAAWSADYTPESLGPLGDWLATHVESRSRTPDELKEISALSTYPIEIPTSELTNKTFSLAMDIGMYLAQVFLRNHASVKWNQPLKGSKRFIDYGQPVLVGLGVVPLNPVQMTVTLT